MNKEKERVIYAHHPVSPERKAELRAKGFQIIDAAFMPDGYENPVCAPAEADGSGDGETTKRRGRSPKE